MANRTKIDLGTHILLALKVFVFSLTIFYVAEVKPHNHVYLGLAAVAVPFFKP
jgi:hypothetical protein